MNHISGVTSVKLAANWWPSMGQNMILFPCHLDWTKRWFRQELFLGDPDDGRLCRLQGIYLGSFI